MLSLIFQLLIGLLDTVTRWARNICGWYRNQLASAKEKPASLVKIFLVTMLIIYGVTRIIAIYDLIGPKKGPAGYTEEQIEYLNQNRVERYVRLMEKTQYYDRYMNTVDWLEVKEKNVLAATFVVLTHSKKAGKFHRHVYKQYLVSIYERNPKELEQYIGSQRWIKKHEKEDYRKAIVRLHDKQKKS